MKILTTLCWIFPIVLCSQTKNFRGTFDELQAEAKQKDKPYLVEFYATWCGYCKKFDREVMTDSSFYAPVNKHLLFQKINGEFDTKTSKQFNIKGYPSFILFAPDGSILKKINGYQTAEDFNKLFTQLELTKAKTAYNFTSYREARAINLVKLKDSLKSTPLLQKIYLHEKKLTLIDCEELIIEYPEHEDYIKYYYNYINKGFNLKETQTLYDKELLSDEETAFLFMKNIQYQKTADRSDLAFVNLLLAKNNSIELFETKAYVLLEMGKEKEAKEVISQGIKTLKKSKTKSKPTEELRLLIK